MAVTNEDICVCECGCEFFIDAYLWVKVTSAMIGETKIGQHLGSKRPFCVKCGKILDADRIDTRKTRMPSSQKESNLIAEG